MVVKWYLGSHFNAGSVEVNLIWGQVFESLMRALTVVPIEVTGQLAPGVAAIVKSMQVDALVLDRAPQPFNEDVVPVTALAVHADAYVMSFQDIGESR